MSLTVTNHQPQGDAGSPQRSRDERSEVRRSGGLPASAATRPPDPELPAKPRRRKFAYEDKLRILQETDAARGSGAIGAILRREGIYSSLLDRWRKQRQKGTLNGLARRVGRPRVEESHDARRIAELEHERDALAQRLKQAELIIDVQKKISEILGIPLKPPTSGANV